MSHEARNDCSRSADTRAMELSVLRAMLRSLADVPLSELLWGVFIRLWLVVSYSLFFYLVLVALVALGILIAWLALRPRTRRTEAPPRGP